MSMRVCVCVFVCVSAPKAINNYWCDVVWYGLHLIGQISSMAFVWQPRSISIVHGHVVGMYMRRGNYPDKSKLVLYSCYFTVMII